MDTKTIDAVKKMLETLLTNDSPCTEANRAYILGHVEGMKTWKAEEVSK